MTVRELIAKLEQMIDERPYVAALDVVISKAIYDDVEKVVVDDVDIEASEYDRHVFVVRIASYDGRMPRAKT